MPSFADHTFAPWRRDGERRILADERHWREPLLWNAEAVEREDFRRGMPDTIRQESRRPLVLVDYDWATDTGLLIDHTGDRPLLCNVCGKWHDESINKKQGSCECGRFGMRMDWLTFDDCRQRLLDIAAKCDSLDWLFVTESPERVSKLLARHTAMTGPGTEDCEVPSNFWLAARVRDQQEADERLPELLRVRQVAPASKLVALADELRGPVDWSHTLGTLLPSEHGRHNWCERGIDWLILDGGKTFATEVFRDSIRQCREAGVPVWVERLGAKMHWNGVTCIPGEWPRDPSEWPEDLRARERP